MNDYSVKNIRQDFKSKGIFYTPKELTLYLKSLVDVPYSNVYDPTCGRGNLLAEFDDNIAKYGQDTNADEIEVASQRLKNFQGVVGDTLKNPAFMDMKFDLIIANPPFSIPWEVDEKDIRFEKVPCIPPKSKADYVFIFHCLHLLKDTGQAIIMEFPGILYRGQREGKLRQYLIEQNYIEKVIHIDGNKFTDTSIATCVLVLKKNKTSTDIEFIDSSKDISRVVGIDEVRENNFNLSVSQYVQEEKEVEQIDIDSVNLEIINLVIKRVKDDFERFKMMSILENKNYCKILAEGLRAVLKQYYIDNWEM